MLSTVPISLQNLKKEDLDREISRAGIIAELGVELKKSEKEIQELIEKQKTSISSPLKSSGREIIREP